MLGLKSMFKLVAMKDIEEYYYNNGRLSRACHITFDDGHKSLYENVFPIVRKHRIPISVFVSPKIVEEGCNYWFQEVAGFDNEKILDIASRRGLEAENGGSRKDVMEILKSLPIARIQGIIKEYRERHGVGPLDRQNIGTQQMREMQESGLVTFGAHTVNHPVLPNEDDETSEFEIKRSIEWLSDLLGNEVKYWAFPNGDCTPREIAYLRKYKICNAFTTKMGTRFSRRSDPLTIPRVGFSFGSRRYLYMKMAFGKYWDKARRIRKRMK